MGGYNKKVGRQVPSPIPHLIAPMEAFSVRSQFTEQYIRTEIQ